ncbi:MAG TPA: sulfatase-like hydrolase/transferase [Scandinavium sp.]|jgi:arylsulfatase A-like enzyme|uniref:sulfatase family protein n=1 Tax=Scandinavium sp. TaxID=2830653 RepID=UPI002E355FA2|nr:sulfatase-like hydrolase/transferase [Scandinavium sp.]HEX4500314.1 sulfatase-like hydrolase/transferase [Scandinavium sp.]
MQKKVLSALVTGLLCSSSFLHASQSMSAELQGTAKQANVIVIMADDLGYGDLGSYGHPIVQTPNLDALANEGMRFTQYYAPSPLCSPSRAGFLTGRSPFRTGIRSWIPMGKNVALGRNEKTIANYLKDQGYDTAMMGKLHLNAGADRTDQPQAKDMGFDYSLVNAAGFVTSDLDKAKERPRYGVVYPNGFYRNGQPIGTVKKYSGELVSDEALHWLSERKDNNPFFMYVAFTEVHTPLASPKKYLDLYEKYMSEYEKKNQTLFYADWADKPWRGTGEYYANISFLDEQVGKILKKVKEMGQEDNTIILFTSDNGPVTREARKWYELNMAGETGGLRGRKDNLWDGGIRVPAIIKYPHHIKAGSVSDTPVTGLDVLPTLAQMLHFPLPTDRVIDGESIEPVLEGKTISRTKPLIWAIDMPYQDDPVDMWAIREGDWKMIIDREGNPKYLYDMKHDTGEVNNLIGKNPDVRKVLRADFEKYKNSIEHDSLMSARGEKPEPVDWN